MTRRPGAPTGTVPERTDGPPPPPSPPVEREGACPICGRAARAPFEPFCSGRCADVDLGRWLSDRYVLPDPDEGTDGPA